MIKKLFNIVVSIILPLLTFSFLSIPAFAQIMPTCDPNTQEIKYDPAVGFYCAPKAGTGSNIGNPVGTINPPGLPKADNPNQFVSSLVRTILSILLIVAFIIAFISLLIAGIQFITSGGDPKNVSAAQSKIFWGLIGLVVVLSSFGIIMLVEKVFSVNILSGGLNLPRI